MKAERVKVSSARLPCVSHALGRPAPQLPSVGGCLRASGEVLRVNTKDQSSYLHARLGGGRGETSIAVVPQQIADTRNCRDISISGRPDPPVRILIHEE